MPWEFLSEKRGGKRQARQESCRANPKDIPSVRQQQSLPIRSLPPVRPEMPRASLNFESVWPHKVAPGESRGGTLENRSSHMLMENARLLTARCKFQMGAVPPGEDEQRTVFLCGGRS